MDPKKLNETDLDIGQVYTTPEVDALFNISPEDTPYTHLRMPSTYTHNAIGGEKVERTKKTERTSDRLIKERTRLGNVLNDIASAFSFSLNDTVNSLQELTEAINKMASNESGEEEMTSFVETIIKEAQSLGYKTSMNAKYVVCEKFEEKACLRIYYNRQVCNITWYTVSLGNEIMEEESARGYAEIGLIGRQVIMRDVNALRSVREKFIQNYGEHKLGWADPVNELPF